MKTLKEFAKEKFEKGAKEHGQPWDNEHIDVISEMRGELGDVYNYADLFEDPWRKVKYRMYAQDLWNDLDELEAGEKNLDKKTEE